MSYHQRSPVQVQKETYLFPLPAFFSSTRHDREQNVRLHLGHSGKFRPLALQTPQTTCFVRADLSSAAANSGSIVQIESDSEGSKGNRRRGAINVVDSRLGWVETLGVAAMVCISGGGRGVELDFSDLVWRAGPGMVFEGDGGSSAATDSSTKSSVLSDPVLALKELVGQTGSFGHHV